MFPLIIGGTDLETTGLLDSAHRIVEVCVLRFDYDPASKLIRPIDSYTQRIDPDRSIEAKAQGVHGISNSDLIGKPKWPEVAPTVFERLNGCDVVVAHNGFEFDFPFLIQEFERIGHPIPEFIPFDTMQDGRWATPYGKVPTLKELCFSCGVLYDSEEAHAAEYDVLVMMNSFFFGLRRGVFTLSTT